MSQLLILLYSWCYEGRGRVTQTVPREYGFSGGGPVLRNDFVSRPTHSAHLPSRAPSRVRLENASMSKNTSVPLYQHVRAELVSPRIKALAAGWQVWNSEQEGNGETFHIDYDGDYGSERVLIVSGRAILIPAGA